MALSFMNITEKILARASEKNTVSPDDIVFAKVDKVMVHDVSGPGVLKVFDKLQKQGCLLYTSPSPRDATLSRMPSSA